MTQPASMNNDCEGGSCKDDESKSLQDSYEDSCQDSYEYSYNASFSDGGEIEDVSATDYEDRSREGDEGGRLSPSAAADDWEWEAVGDDNDQGDISERGGPARERVVLELPDGGLRAEADPVAPDGSAFSSFADISRWDSAHASSYSYAASSRRGGDDLTLSVGATFEMLSLASGEVVRRCNRCTFHNPLNSATCACCALALVVNPHVDADAQLALQLQAKEEEEVNYFGVGVFSFFALNLCIACH